LLSSRTTRLHTVNPPSSLIDRAARPPPLQPSPRHFVAFFLFSFSLPLGLSVRFSLFFKMSLPESEFLPSVGLFAECLLSGTRQRRLCREPPSVKLGSRQRSSLPSVGHSAPDPTRQRHLCRMSNTRQRRLSAKGRQRASKS
jgi:hypothetical protein